MAYHFIRWIVTESQFPTSSAKVADPTGKPNDLVRLSKFFGLTPSYNKKTNDNKYIICYKEKLIGSNSIKIKKKILVLSSIR